MDASPLLLCVVWQICCQRSILRAKKLRPTCLGVGVWKHFYLIPLLVFVLIIPVWAQHREFVPSGTQIHVRAENTIDVARRDRGQVFVGHVDRDVRSRYGDLVIPRGARCELTVRQVNPGELALDLESINVEGRRYQLDASGPEFNMEQGNNGMIGNIIGAIAGASGGSVQYHGDRIEVPAGSELTFQLQQPLRVFEHDRDYDYDHYRH